MDSTLLKGNELSTGYDRLMLDLLFDLVAGNTVDSQFRYEDQLDYYRARIFGDSLQIDDLCDYADKFKKATKIMFPCSPTQIRSKSFLVRLFASYVMIHNLYRAASFDAVTDESEFLKQCIKDQELNEETFAIFEKEIRYLYGQYTTSLIYEQYCAFCSQMYAFIDSFEEAYQAVADCVLGHTADIKKDSFTVLCEKNRIPENQRIMFKLQVDAIAEVKVCESDFVEYFESLRYSWEQRFPNYSFGEEVKDYINEYKRPFILIYGNQLRNLRKDMQLFEMLACVNIKIALANGARNFRALDRNIRKQTYDLAANLRSVFTENKKKIISYYHLDRYRGVDFEPQLNDAMIPFKKELMYLNELLMEEINYRNQDNATTKGEKTILRNARDLSEYEFLLAEKEKEIHDLRRELEYYENIEAQSFKSEVSQYDKALMEMVQRLCDTRYGSVLNELYLVSSGKKETSMEQVRSLIQNMIFVFSSFGINPTETAKIGKRVKFYSDMLDEVYTFDQASVQEGLNIGHVIYPGWKYKDSDLVMPRVNPCKEGEE